MNCKEIAELVTKQARVMSPSEFVALLHHTFLCPVCLTWTKAILGPERRTELDRELERLHARVWEEFHRDAAHTAPAQPHLRRMDAGLARRGTARGT